METKDRHLRRCYDDNYSSSISVEQNIPDMLAVYHHPEEMDDLKMNAQSAAAAALMSITGLRKNDNNLYILNAKNESLNTTECGSHPSRKLLFDKHSQIPTIPYPRCNLSGNDCIKKSILYSDRKTTHFDKLPVIHSASASSSDIEYPADEESNACSLISDDKTYSVCETTDDTYTVSDDRSSSNLKILEKYPDSFDDSDSGCLGVSDEDSSSDKTPHCNVDKGVVGVVEKVINNYHNLLRNFYDPVSGNVIDKPILSSSSTKSNDESLINDIILEPPDMFSDTIPAAQSSDAESTFQYLSYVNPPASLDDRKYFDSDSYSSNISTSPSTDNIFKSKTAIDYVINYLNEGFDVKGGGISDGSTIEADDLESFYSESDPLNGTLTEQDVRFSFESDASTEFKIPKVLISSTDDTQECNESDDGISHIIPPLHRVHSELNERFEVQKCKTKQSRDDSRVIAKYSDIQTSFCKDGSINEQSIKLEGKMNSEVDYDPSIDLNWSNAYNLRNRHLEESKYVNESFDDAEMFMDESIDEVDSKSNHDQMINSDWSNNFCNLQNHRLEETKNLNESFGDAKIFINETINEVKSEVNFDLEINSNLSSNACNLQNHQLARSKNIDQSFVDAEIITNDSIEEMDSELSDDKATNLTNVWNLQNRELEESENVIQSVFINESVDEVDSTQNPNDVIDPLDSLLFDSWQPIFSSPKPLLLEEMFEDDHESEFSVADSSCSSSSIEDDEKPDDDVTESAAEIEERHSGDENRNDDVIEIVEQVKPIETDRENNNVPETGSDQCITQFSSDNCYLNTSSVLENILTIDGGSFGAKCSICTEQNPAIYDTIQELLNLKNWGSRCLQIVLFEPISWQKVGWSLLSNEPILGTSDANTITSCNRFLELRDEDDDATSYMLNWKDASLKKEEAAPSTESIENKGDDYSDSSANGNNRVEAKNGDSIMESSTNVLISSTRFDGMPNPSFFDTVSEARRTTATASATATTTTVAKDKQQESVTGGRQLTGDDDDEGEGEEEDVPVAEHGIHATMASDTKTIATTVVAGAYDNSSVENDLHECRCLKSVSNGARPDLSKWRSFPPSLGEIMRSLNSSKLDLTGRVPLSELCVFKAHPSCNNERFAFAASHIDDCLTNFACGDCGVRDQQSCSALDHGGADNDVNSRRVLIDLNPVQGVNQCSEKNINCQQNDYDQHQQQRNNQNVENCTNKFTNLYVNNLEAIRKFSEYFKTSLETDSKLREGIPDLNLHSDLGDGLFSSSPSPPEKSPPVSSPSHPKSSPSSLHQEQHHLKNEKSQQNEHITNVVPKEDVTSFIFSESDESVENLANDSMKNKKKPSNDNDSSMDSSTTETPPKPPGILKTSLKRSKKVHRKKHRVQFDESLNKFFEADYVILVRDDDFEDEYICECGDQFCDEGCYYDDDDDDNVDDVEYENAVDSPRFDFAAAFDPPMEFVDPVTLSPPDGYKDGSCQDVDNVPSQKVSTSTMTAHENQIHRKKEASVDAENWQNFQSNENIATFNEKVKTQDCTNDDGFTKRDQHLRNQRYPFHGNDVNASSQLALFNDQNVQPTNGQSRYIVETITMTTVTERRIVREAANDQLKMVGDMSMMNDRGAVGGSGVGMPGDKYNNAAAAAAAAAGILKGGKLWRNQDPANNTTTTTPASSSSEIAKRMEMEKEDDKRSVKFIRDENHHHHHQQDSTDNCDTTNNRAVGENDKEFMLTFKLGNRVVPCNSLKPNSAVRQLFPDPRFVNPPTILDLEDDNLGKCEGKYLVTEESLRAFNEVNKRSVFAISGKERYPYKDGNFTVHSDDEDIPQNDLIKKTIERNTLRRSLMRYPRGAGGERKREKKKKIEPSLEERIKQLTCVDDQDDQTINAGTIPGSNGGMIYHHHYHNQLLPRDHYRVDDPIPPRTSPPGEESHETPCKSEKSSSSSSSMSSTYKKFTDLFARNKAAAAASGSVADNQNEQHYPYYQPVYHTMSAIPAQPDLGIDYKLQSGPLMVSKQAQAAVAAAVAANSGGSKVAGGSNEARKQFLSSLAPLTACVTGHMEQNSSTTNNYGDRDTLKLKLAGDRHSIVSTASTGTEYSVGDIDDALGKPEEGKAPQPDVVAGTPSGQDSQDELAMFVQQDAGRIERIKKRYSNTPSTVSDDDEHDDYGFSRRPSVRGIKPRFGSTNEILQQMQAQLQQPSSAIPGNKSGSHMTWPYYSAECGIVDKNGGPVGATSPRNALPALKEESGDAAKAEYTAKVVWEKCSATGTIPRAGVGTVVSGLQQPLKIDANNVQMFRLTPSDTITEVAVPYKCGGDPNDQKDLRRFPAGNVFQMKVSPVATTQVRLPMGVPDGSAAAGQFTAHPIPVGTTSVIRVGHGQQQTFRVPCPVSGPVQVHLLATHPYENAQIRSSSQPIHFPPQIVVAKGTQTSTISTTSFYQLQTNTQSHYQNTPVTKAAASEHTTKLIQVNYNAAAAQHQSPPISSLTSSPTRVKNQNHMIERGIPEGAVSSSPAFIQDCVKPPQSSPLQLTDAQNNTQNQSQTKSASLMYGMKV